MSDDYINNEPSLIAKLHFEPSTIETIDRAMLNYLKNLDLYTETNQGWRKTPVLWGSAERSFQSKNDKEIRDAQGMLIMPIMTLSRVSLEKDMTSKGVFQGGVPKNSDEQGGSLPVSRVLYQEKTTKFANADARRLNGQLNYPRPNGKVVYRTITVPMPVNVTIMYEIVIRTEYQQQMNQLLLPFITKPGTINYQRLFEGEHRYEAFIQGSFQGSNNVSDFSSDERKFETKIQVKVVGYLVGEGGNATKPHYAIRENAVEVKIPRERTSLSEIPEHEFGSYYGLSGVPLSAIFDKSNGASLFSNVAAANAPAAGSGGSGGSGVDSTTTVTRSNFSDVLKENLVIREVIKENNVEPPDPATTFNLTNVPKLNTESIYVNGAIQSVGVDNDYTISGKTITFNYNIEADDNVYATYIKD
jgi:hypothetical protein